MLEVDNLACSRGDRPLFRGLSFTLAPGELIHVTGRNGAGKTTLLRTVCGLSRPAEGAVRWQQQDIRILGDEYHAQLGYVGHANGIQGELTTLENLRFTARLSGQEGVSPVEVLGMLGLAPFSHLPTKVLSQGQKRRLALARLLVTRAPLWVLDEPFTALDTQTVALMEDQIRAHVAARGMVILTSHQAVTLKDGRHAREIPIGHDAN